MILRKLERPAVARATQLLTDLGAPVLIAAAAAHELQYNGSPLRTWLLVQASIWPLVWRRRAPVLVFSTCLVLVLVLWATHVATVADLAMLVALYTVAAHRDFRYALGAAMALELGVVLVALRFAPAKSINDAVVLLSGLAAAALFMGTTLRAKRRYLASLEDRAQRLERERAQQAELAAAAERARIAREMHDIVAHGLAVVITLSEGAVASWDTNPASARDAVHEVAVAGRQSLAEMRRLLDVLRTDEVVERGPQPGLAALEALFADVRTTGLTVHLRSTGDPGALSQTVQATVYRIVQEALTNVLKHARQASTVTIKLDCRPTAISFVIQDDGHPARRDLPSAPPAGNGLTGMRERVAMFDGTLDAGPTDAGWSVRGRLQPG